MSLLAGIDPGITGAIAFLKSDGELVSVHDIPTLELARGKKKRRVIGEVSLLKILADAEPSHAFLEDVHSMPKQGVASTFSFGEGFGIIKGTLTALGIPRTMIDPRDWKKALKVPAAKDGARYRASQLFPGAAENWPLVKHDGRAEACLIALFGLSSFRAIVIDPPAILPGLAAQ